MRMVDGKSTSHEARRSTIDNHARTFARASAPNPSRKQQDRDHGTVGSAPGIPGSAGETVNCACRVARALAAAARRFLVVAALRPAARRFRVVAAFAPASRRLRVVAALRAAALRFRVITPFFDGRAAMAAQSSALLPCVSTRETGAACDLGTMNNVQPPTPRLMRARCMRTRSRTM